VGETFLQFPRPVTAPDGTRWEARACGAAMTDGLWHGWLEFVPVGGGEVLRSPRETTQPNRTDAEYWATGLTDVYLQGALQRTLDGPPIPLAPSPVQPSVFSGPAPSSAPVGAASTSVLDPFSVFEKGEALLRKQLGALSAWHLVNIALDYRLTTQHRDSLNRMAAVDLIELIVRGVRQEIERRHPA